MDDLVLRANNGLNQRLTFAENDASSIHIVGRDFNNNSIAWYDPNKVLTHFSGNVC